MKFIILSLAMVACILSLNGYSFKRTTDRLTDKENGLLRRMGFDITRTKFGEKDAKEVTKILDMCLDKPLRDIQSCVKEEGQTRKINDDICETIENLVDIALDADEAVNRVGCPGIDWEKDLPPSFCVEDLCFIYCELECADGYCHCGCGKFGSLLKNKKKEEKKSEKAIQLKRLRSMMKIRKLIKN